MSNVTSSENDAPWEKLGITTLPMPNVMGALDVIWNMPKRITLCLVGDTGIGKTPIVHQWVKNKGGFLYTLNFGHMSPEDVSMSMFNEDATEFGFVQSSWFAEVNRKAAETGCAVLFLDEWNRGDKRLVNALFTLTDDKRIHNHFLHPNVMVVAAMNPSDGTYLVNEAERDHAIRKRLCFAYVVPDLASWLKHGEENNFHPLILGIVRAQTNLFYDTAARDAGKAFSCPSNLEKASDLLKSAEALGMLHTSTTLSLLSGQLGYTAASVIVEYMRDKNSVIGPDEVLERYHTTGRGRIAKLLGKKIDKRTGELQDGDNTNIRVDVLSTLNESIALTLLSSKPPLDDVLDNVRSYVLDLPDELFVSFFAIHLRRFGQELPDAKDYVKRLHLALPTGKDADKVRRRMSSLVTRMNQIDDSRKSA